MKKQTHAQKLEAKRKELADLQKVIQEEHIGVAPKEIAAQEKRLEKEITRLEVKAEEAESQLTAAQEAHGKELVRLDTRLEKFKKDKGLDKLPIEAGEFNSKLAEVMQANKVMDANEAIPDPSAITDEVLDSYMEAVHAKLTEGSTPIKKADALPSQDDIPGDTPTPDDGDTGDDVDKVLAAMSDPTKIVNLDAINEERAIKGKSDFFAEVGARMVAERDGAEAGASANAA